MKPNQIIGADRVSDTAIRLYVKACYGSIWVVDAPAATTLDHAVGSKDAREVVIDMDAGNSRWREEYAVIAVYVGASDQGGLYQTHGFLLEVTERNGHAYVELEHVHQNAAFPLAAVVGRDTLVLPVSNTVYVHGTPTREGMLQVPRGAICRALVSMDTRELEESAQGETLEQKLTRLELELQQAREWVATAMSKRDAYFEQFWQIARVLFGEKATSDWVREAVNDSEPTFAQRCEVELAETRDYAFVNGLRARSEEVGPKLGKLWSNFDPAYPVEMSEHDVDRLLELLDRCVRDVVQELRAIMGDARQHKFLPHGDKLVGRCRKALGSPETHRRDMMSSR